MKITFLKKHPSLYSCNVYFVQGTWNTISDVNTLIDVGTNGFVKDEIDRMSTGVGKKRLEQVILTHEHFDHAGGLSEIKQFYKPKVYAFSFIDGVDYLAKDGMKLRIGDQEAEIIHTPGHSNDSICIYCAEEGALFSGDTPLNIKSPGGTYSSIFIEILKRLLSLKINSIYSGHDYPIISNVKEMLEMTLRNVKKSNVIS
ncbi:MAG: hypothetical protein QG635_431 [Bacteroidota bacterium]|nr:hypothetical protein [Bacteroidota bacterium]